jgi:hypothetical protein
VIPFSFTLAQFPPRPSDLTVPLGKTKTDSSQTIRVWTRNRSSHAHCIPSVGFLQSCCHCMLGLVQATLCCDCLAATDSSRDTYLVQRQVRH